MSLNFRPESFSTPPTGAEAGLNGVDLSQMQVNFHPPVDSAALSSLPSGIELTGAVPAPTGLEAQAMASFAPPPMDATPMLALAGANEPISPIIQLIMRMPGAMGLMNSFFEALGQFFFAQSPLAGLFDHTLFTHLGAAGSQMKLGMPGVPGLEHSAINMSVLPQNAPIFSSLGMGAHSFAGNMLPFDSLAGKFATPGSLNLNVSPEHFSGMKNSLNVSGSMDLNKPQFEWSSKFGEQQAGGGYGEMLSGPQLSDGKLASHLGGTQRLFSDKLPSASGLANRMPLNSQPALANNTVNQSLSQSIPLSNNVPSINVGNQAYGAGGGAMNAAGSMRDIAPVSADNNVGFRMGSNTTDAGSLDAASANTGVDATSDKLLAYNNNESFRPNLGGADKGVQAVSDSSSQWTQPQTMAKPSIKMEGLKAKQLTFDSLKDAGAKTHTSAASAAQSSGQQAAHSAKSVMDHQGHQMRAGGNSAGHGMDHVSHRSLPKVEYHKPTAPQHVEKPQLVAEAKPQQIAQNQPEALNQTQAQPQDATSVTGDQAVAPATTTAAPTPYTIRAGDNLWSIAKNQLGDGVKWQDIFNANKDILGSNPDLIHPGTQINLPGQEVAANQASNYVVKSGDSLWKISQDLLGDGNKWGELYQANASIIGNNPRMIMPGQELTIPGMGGSDALAQGAASTGQQTAQAAGQSATQTAAAAPTGDIQQQFAAAEPQAMQAQAAPQEVQPVQQAPEQAINANSQSGAGGSQLQPASYQPQAPQTYQQLPAANVPADKNSVVSSTMVPTDIVDLFRKAK